MAEAGRGVPAEAAALMLAIADAQAAIDHDRETQPAAGAEVEHAYASLHPVIQGHEANPGELRQRATALSDLPAGQSLPVERCHAVGGPRASGAGLHRWRRLVSCRLSSGLPR